VERFQIPQELFRNLLTAFRADVTIKRYGTYEDVLAYCRYSANPVGRLLLLLFNYRNETTMHLSDSICTALQLTNFWQDVSVDLLKDRIYLPLEDLEEFGYSEQDLLEHKVNEPFGILMAFQVRRAAELFAEGKPLLTMVDKDLSMELKLTWISGMKILQKIHKQHYDVLTKRPALSKLDKLGLLFRSFLS
jgi:squalene synthase HpnC